LINLSFKYSTMKTLKNTTLRRKGEAYNALLIAFLFLCTFGIDAQHVEIQGKAKVSIMDTVDTENLLVVKQPDGTLATRQVSTLPPDQPDTIRTYATDIELNRLLCECVNDMKPFLVRSSLERGYSVQDLYQAGIPSANLVSGGATVVELLDAGATPMDIYNGGVPQDSLYGKLYQEGLIFYMDTEDTIPGVEGLVSTLVDQGVPTWGCHGTVITGADGIAVGTGAQNTIDIEAGCTTPGIAADTCANLVINGYDDWFLPSKDELSLMYQNLHMNGLGNFITGWHWTSTEGNSTGAWYVSFVNGIKGQATKSSVLRVRAVRAF
jgi:hypothetical protein